MLLEISGAWAAKEERKAKARAWWLSVSPELGPHLASGLFSPHFDLLLMAVKMMETLMESPVRSVVTTNKKVFLHTHTQRHRIIYLTCATLCHRMVQRLKSPVSSESKVHGGGIH